MILLFIRLRQPAPNYAMIDLGPGNVTPGATITIPLTATANATLSEQFAGGYTYGGNYTASLDYYDADDVWHSIAYNVTFLEGDGVLPEPQIYEGSLAVPETQYFRYDYFENWTNSLADLGDKTVLTPGVYVFPSWTALANFNGTLVAVDLPADPRSPEDANFFSMNSLGIGLTEDNELWMNGREIPMDELLPSAFTSGNDAVTFNVCAEDGTTAVGTTASGNVVLLGSVYIDPIGSHFEAAVNPTNPSSWVMHYFSTHSGISTNATVGANLNSNVTGNSAWITNPAVIVQNETVQLVAHADSTFLKLIGGANHLYWDVDNDSGDPGNLSWADLLGANATAGTVTFSGNNHESGNYTFSSILGDVTTSCVCINVTGGNIGRVRFTLKWDKYGNGTLVPLDQVANVTVTPPQIKYEAYVGQLLTMPCRFERLFYDTTHTPSPAPGTILNAMRVANVYLRQAGIELVPDSNTTVMNTISDLSNTTLDPTDTANITIFNVHASGNVNAYYWSGNAQVRPLGSIDSDYTAYFLANNHNPNVLQIALVGIPINGDPGETAATRDIKATDYGFTEETDPSVTGSGSPQLDYIVSLNDTGNLSDAHYLHIFEFHTSMPTVDITGADFTDLYGATLFTGTGTVGYGNLSTNFSEPNLLGRTLAHEVGHVLGLQHRVGSIPSQNFTDGLNIQTNLQGFPLNYLPSTNLMDHPDLFSDQVPEDIDLLQALIMRNHVGNNTNSLLHHP